MEGKEGEWVNKGGGKEGGREVRTNKQISHYFYHMYFIVNYYH